MADRGDVWLIDLSEPPKGHEQAGNRPALIVSVNKLNHGPAELAIVVPISKTGRANIPTHIPIDPPEGGLLYHSFAKCEAVRSISTSKRLLKHMGVVSGSTMKMVEDRLRLVLGL